LGEKGEFFLHAQWLYLEVEPPPQPLPQGEGQILLSLDGRGWERAGGDFVMRFRS